MPGSISTSIRGSRIVSLAVALLALGLVAGLVYPASADAEAHPVVGDWNGNGRASPGWFVDGTVVLRDATVDGRALVFNYGRAGDRPVAGDWNGDGRDTIGVVRGNRWLLKNDHSGGAADHSFVYGRLTKGDYPLAGDWNGSGSDTVGIVRDGVWHLRNSLSGGAADLSFVYGRVIDGDVPMVGDWNADGRDTPGIFRDGVWYLRDRNTGGNADRVIAYGRATDAPVVGNWNGSGGDTLGVVRGDMWLLTNRLAGGDADTKIIFGPKSSEALVSEGPKDEAAEPNVEPTVPDASEDIAEPSPSTSTGVQEWQFISAGSQTSGRWQTFDVIIDERSEFEAVADWSGDADVNIFLRQDDVAVAYARSTTAKPERFTYVAEAGVYELAVLVRTGEASYVVDAVATPLTSSRPEIAPEEPSNAAPSEAALTPAYPGQPAGGTVFWGASIEGNGDPVTRHEQHAGVPMALRRTFFQWRHIDSNYLAHMARDDLAAGRLPWVSIKTPSWAEMAAGSHDAQIDKLLRQLDGLDGPVWLTVWHEPEGGGGVNTPDDPAGPSGHLAMNRQVRTRMTELGVDNVALAPIFMAWTWNERSGRDIDEWWDDGVYDFLGVDYYCEETTSMLTPGWARVRSWAAEKGVDVAVGEWGLRGTDAAAGAFVHEWYEHAIGSATDGQGARVVGLSAFDSGLNSPTGSWELRGAQLDVFRTLMKDERNAQVR